MIFGAGKVLEEFVQPNSQSGLSFWAFLTIIPLVLILSAGPTEVFASHELTLYRMQQFDVDKVQHGSRYSTVNLEIRTLKSLSQSYSKKCLIITIDELIQSADTYESLIEETTVGGVLIILPKSFSSLSGTAKEQIKLIEQSMLEKGVDIPVYFAYTSNNLQAIYTELTALSESQSRPDSSAFDQLFYSVIANGYQLSTHAVPAKPIANPILTNIETRLVGNENDDQMPTVTITAHYDSFGVAPHLSFGADSNASGMISLLELCRLFSKLYSQPKTRPAVNMVFLLTAGGNFNYIGSKKWIEEQLDHTQSSLLADSIFTLSLDSLGHSINDEGLFLHVSKPPKDNTTGSQFYKHLTEISSPTSTKMTMIHKKINLADDFLSWEHERFRLRRLPAFTISALKGAHFSARGTITDRVNGVKVDKLCRNIEIIAESLANIVLNSKEDLDTFKEDLTVSPTSVSSLLNKFLSYPRSQQLLLTTFTAPSNFKVHPLLESLSNLLKKYSKRTRFHHFKLDPKDPEIVFYDQLTVQAQIFNIKPAIFDFFLSIAIVIYLGFLYLFLSHFSTITLWMKKIKSLGKSKENGNSKNKAN